jgi:peroxiredoxin
MTIKVGDSIPSMTLMAATADGPVETTTEEVFQGKTVVLFGVPGAFTPTCTVRHLPGFIENQAAFADKGVDTVACMAVNDAFVLQAWAKDQKVGDAVQMLADGSGTLTRALGLEMDATAYGMGMRSQRFALVAKDGKVVHIAVEQPGQLDVSRAESVLTAL